jgi:hypothetical protein
MQRSCTSVLLCGSGASAGSMVNPWADTKGPHPLNGFAIVSEVCSYGFMQRRG